MKNALEQIKIAGLHGNKNMVVKIKDNTLILVGENGSGKTTFLRILFHFLSGRWLSLAQFQFDTISITVNGELHEVAKSEVIKHFRSSDRRLFRDFPAIVRHKLVEILELGRTDRLQYDLQRLSEQYGIPLDMLLRRIETVEEISDTPRDATSERSERKIPNAIEKIRTAMPMQILYLPTYRRIERELGSIFEGADLSDLRRSKGNFRLRETDESFIELVEFGMKDVQEAVEKNRVSLKEFARESLNNLTLRYLGDVVNQEYQNVGMKEIADISEDTIRAALDRIDETILNKEHKRHLFEALNSARSNDDPNEHSKIISHYFLKLLRFQEALQEKEQSISAFCALCSEYTNDKRFVYDSSNFSFSIVPKNAKEQSQIIELSDLSSGEKQIVSLFSHLYLSGIKSYFVLIDEPELSLSVPWQRRFLADIRSGVFCDGLIAVTHSPFIYDNELRPYAHSLGEFVGV